MAKFMLLVLSNVVGDQHDEFNDWYTNRHLSDMLAVPGVKSAERYRVMQGGGHGYSALYNLDCDDPAKLLEVLSSRFGTDAMPVSATVDGESAVMMLLEPIAQRS